MSTSGDQGKPPQSNPTPETGAPSSSASHQSSVSAAPGTSGSASNGRAGAQELAESLRAAASRAAQATSEAAHAVVTRVSGGEPKHPDSSAEPERVAAPAAHAAASAEDLAARHAATSALAAPTPATNGALAATPEQSEPTASAGPATVSAAAVSAGVAAAAAPSSVSGALQAPTRTAPPAPNRPGVTLPADPASTGTGTGTVSPSPTNRSAAESHAAAARRAPRLRKARLRLLRVDPWSVMKTAFLLSIAVGVMIVVAAAVIWSILDAAGVFSGVGDVVRDVTASESNTGFQLEEYLGFSRVMGFSMLIAVIDVVLLTALATLGAFLYNLSASLLGGLELTLAEDD